jgi:hypothetical protein
MPKTKPSLAGAKVTRLLPSHPINVTARGGPPAGAVEAPVVAAQPPIYNTDVDFAALDGLRAVACVAVICFHCLLYWGALLDLDTGRKVSGGALLVTYLTQLLASPDWKSAILYALPSTQALDASPLLRLAMHGNAGVDVFLVLCGMWAALHLIPALESVAAAPEGTPGAGVWPSIKQYYKKRVLRVLPPYFTALALVAFAIDHSKASSTSAPAPSPRWQLLCTAALGYASHPCCVVPPQDADPALRANHDTVFEYCPDTMPLNFLLLNNLAGFGGCGVVSRSAALLQWTGIIVSLLQRLHLHFAVFLCCSTFGAWQCSCSSTWPSLWCSGACSPGALPTAAVFCRVLVLVLIVFLSRCRSRHGFRCRVARASLFTLALGSALRWGAAHAADVRLPLPAYAHPDLGADGADIAVRYYHTLYFATPARAGNLATGVLLALVLGDTGTLAALRRRRWALTAAATLVVGAAARMVLAHRLYGSLADQAAWPHAKAFAALAYHGSPLYCAVVAAVVLCIGLHANPAAGQAALFMKTHPVRHLATVSCI